MIDVMIIQGPDSMSAEEISAQVEGEILDALYSDNCQCWVILTQPNSMKQQKRRIQEARNQIAKAVAEQRRRQRECIEPSFTRHRENEGSQQKTLLENSKQQPSQEGRSILDTLFPYTIKRRKLV